MSVDIKQPNVVSVSFENKRKQMLVINQMNALGLDELFLPLKMLHSDCYIVCLARRSFNLEYFWETSQKEFPQHNLCFTNENGILTYADSIARYYLDHREFPAILLYDDFMISGDKVVLCITDLSNAISCALENRNVDIGINEIICGLQDKIKVFVLGQTKRIEDIPLEVFWATNALKSFDTEARHQKSQRVNDLLNEADNPNTSYYLSAKMSKGIKNLICGDKWEKTHAEFDKHKAEQYFYQLSEETMSSAYPFFVSVRVYRKGDHTYITPFNLQPEMTSEFFFRICGSFVRKVRSYKRLTEFAKKVEKMIIFAENGQSWSYRLLYQTMAMLFGQVVLNTFMRDSGIDRSDCAFDFEKISRNFGTLILPEEWKELDNLCLEDAQKDGLRKILNVWKENGLNVNEDIANAQAASTDDRDLCQRAADVIYQLAVHTKKDQFKARYRGKNDSRFIHLSESCKRLEKLQQESVIFESEFMRDCLNSGVSSGEDLYKLIAYIALMADLGYMSFCVREAKKKVGLAFRHSEMSLLLYPKLFGKEKWPEIKRTLWLCTAIQSRDFTLKDAVKMLNRGLYGSNDTSKLKALNNMADALQESSLFLSVLEWNL